ncbi:acyl-CoA dehydrogenase family protein [Sneathiella limimaris]|uniref:acyl-CoA dehydrogenase family protein n=1 Tax=Sneathiella limimaris TaxID=1964213 RepID=UPI00146E5628|nr:acyl-CoA dehydrogenase family protein [Sneathiella limimaris]
MGFRTSGLDAKVREFGAYLKEYRLEWEQRHAAPGEMFVRASEIGLLGLETEPCFGGLGAPFSDKVEMARLLSHQSMACVFALINSQNVASRLRVSSHDRHHAMADELLSAERIGCTALTEPAAGSDFAAIQTRAEKVEGGWRINGTKAWITNAAYADTIMLYAQTDPAKGWKGIASFLIDAKQEGFRRGEVYRLIGGHAIGAGEFHLEDYIAPSEDMLSPPGEAFKYAMGSINGARTYVAAMCVGMMQNALELTTSYGKERQAFGQPLVAHQGYKWSLTDVMTHIAALSGLVEKAARLIDAKEDAVLAAALAKKMAGEVTIPSLVTCMQAMGANGLREEHFLGQHLAAAKIAAFTDGSTEMMKERIGALM